MKLTIPLALTLAFTSCADTYYRQGISTTEAGATRAVPIKAFQKYSQTIGPGRVVVTGNSIIHEWNDPSPNVPRAVSSVFDPKTGITATTETPIVAQSDPSVSTIATGNAMNRAMHGLSNIIGTVFTGWAGVEAAKGMTAIGVTQSNNARNVNNARTAANASVANTKTAASVSKEALKAAPAAGSVIPSTINSTVVPIVP